MENGIEISATQSLRMGLTIKPDQRIIGGEKRVRFSPKGYK